MLFRHGRVRPAGDRWLWPRPCWAALLCAVSPAWGGEDTVALSAQADRVARALQTGQQLQALEWAETETLKNWPPSLLRALAASARELGRNATQGRAVQAWLAQTPASWDARLAQAWWLMDTSQLESAAQALKHLEDGTPPAQLARLHEARGALAELRGDWIAASRHYQALLALRPSHRYAQRLRLLALQRSGAATLALEQARVAIGRDADLFSPREMAEFAQHALAQRQRWALGMHEQDHTAARTELDALLAERAAMLEAVRSWPDLWSALVGDHMQLLVALERHAEALQWHERLSLQGAAPPRHATLAAARAHHGLGRADRAIALYETALELHTRPPEAYSSVLSDLVHAYLDAGRFDDARRLVQRLEAVTPAYVRLGARPGQANPEAAAVQSLRVWVDMQSGHEASAGQRLDALLEQAPTNPWLRSNRQLLLRWQDRPEAALLEARRTLTQHPEMQMAHIDHALALENAGFVGDAWQQLNALDAGHPAVAQARKALQNRLAPRMDVAIDSGQERDGGDLRESWLRSAWSAPLDTTGWRVGYQLNLGRAKGEGVSGRRVHQGLSLQRQDGPWQLSTGAHHDRGGPQARTGLDLRVDWRASDTWRLNASAHSHGLDTPWKAWQVGIHGNAAEAGLAYVYSPTGRVEWQFQRMAYSDGNTRLGQRLNWSEVLQLSSSLRLRGGLAWGDERHRLDKRPYFSPRRQQALLASAQLTWVHWVRNDHRLQHVLAVEAGPVRQAGYGQHPLWQLRYEHQWQLGPQAALAYGWTASSRPYDGAATRRQALHLRFSWSLL